MRVLATLLSCLVASPVLAQDFLQQWRDSAIKGMNEFRAAHAADIKGQGWRFIDGAVNAEGVAIADIFIKDVKMQDASTRSARVLSAFYTPASGSDLPDYQSSNALVWFHCADGRYEHRSVDRYASADGRGASASSDDKQPVPAPLEMRGAEPVSMEKTLLTAVCASPV
ncbi:MAG: surface-adhesin E family protein [Betaproteobacteria bacterium]